MDFFDSDIEELNFRIIHMSINVFIIIYTCTLNLHVHDYFFDYIHVHWTHMLMIVFLDYIHTYIDLRYCFLDYIHVYVKVRMLGMLRMNMVNVNVKNEYREC